MSVNRAGDGKRRERRKTIPLICSVAKETTIQTARKKEKKENG